MDTYVLADLFPPPQTNANGLVLERLTQAGVVPLTISQLVYEWQPQDKSFAEISLE